MVYRRGALLKGLSILQIYLIVISVFSFAFLIYETTTVSAQARVPGGGPPVTNPGIPGGPVTSVGINEAGEIAARAAKLKNLEVPNPSGTQVPPAGAGKDIGYMDRILGDDPLGGWDYWKGGTISHLTSGLIWGGIAYGVVSMIGGFLGLDEFSA